MEDVYEFERLDQIRALSDPMRMEMVRLLARQPLTTAQMAAQLGVRLTKLYYHVNELERVGLLQVVDTRQRGNLIEKYYQPVARRFRVNSALFHAGPEGLQAFFANLTGHLDATAVDLHKLIDAGRLTSEHVDRAVVAQIKLHLSPEREEEFRERLQRLIAEYLDLDREADEPTAALTVLFYPFASGDTPLENPESEEGLR